MAVAVRRLGRQSDDVEPHRQSFCLDDDIWLEYGSRHPAELVNITMLRRAGQEGETKGGCDPWYRMTLLQKGNRGVKGECVGSMFSFSVQYNKASFPATETTQL